MNILIMPESYFPFEWLPVLARTCAKNQMGIITGVEHLKSENKVYNLTAVILPYIQGDNKFAYLYFHHKKYFSPKEKELVDKFGCNPKEGQLYELFCWNDFWFSAYCCYELASIKDRAEFKSYVDALIAIEWNKDTNYYNNIIESLSRDMHCFCLQVNSADYGDSRILQPTKSVEKDLVKVKGGINPTILVDKIDINELRLFQLENHNRKGGLKFKPVPPNFNFEILKRKYNGTLWDYIKRKWGNST